MANITKKYTLSAKGILAVSNDAIGIEDTDTGEFISFVDLLADFDSKSIKMTINYDEEFGAEDDE